MNSNYRITQITSNPSRDLVNFYTDTTLIRSVSAVNDFSLDEDLVKIIIYSSGLPIFEFDVSSIEDIDGTIYTPLDISISQSSQEYQTRVSLISTQLSGIFKGCCAAGGGGGGQTPIQWQDEGTNVGTAGQYTKINITGNATASESAPDTLDIDVTGGGGQHAIQFQDEGANLGSSGTVTHYDVVGDLHKLTRSGNNITHTAPNAGENLQMLGLDPSSPLNVKTGALITNIVSWTTSASRQHNLSLTGWDDTWDASTGTGKATLIVYEGSDWAILTGVAGGSNGRSMTIYNNTNDVVILEHDSTGSLASNRLFFQDALPVFLMPNRSMDFTYIAGRWRGARTKINDLFDDYTPSNNVGGIGNGSMFTDFFAAGTLTWGTLGAGQPDTQYGAISASPAIGARNFVSSTFNAGYTGLNVNTIALTAHKIAFSGDPRNTKRIVVGFGNHLAAAGGFYTSGAMQCGFGYAADSGVANAVNNWFIYCGAGGAVNIAANGLDTGIPVTQAQNEYNVFMVYINVVTGVMKAFYSQDRMAYSFVGTRTGVPTNLSLNLWYEAYGTALPSLYLDYSLGNTKFDLNR